MPAHALLTKADEAVLAVKIQDWLSLQERFQQLEAVLGRHPTNAEWAAEFGQTEREFMERWKDGNRVRAISHRGEKGSDIFFGNALESAHDS